ncbi:helix-turn-helix transcriptional regulator [Ructibacterium gallinarum]|uniref:Helix-turn-helix transcriptional regulator n=1 Tax=Ructibacterium gallinarum TaxID=2779355 RepID=A0A9D5RCR9_9FIRM|nr:AraC family transcriptional regulator [Ructibacterium gallinarum]MBE5041248.1 helix-turn-helix transcriptional regulator [Ructibacterium gallinarum]
MVVSWFLSYIFILLLMIGMSLSLYYESKTTVVEQINLTAGITLEEKKQHIDNIQKNLSIFAAELAENDLVKELCLVEQPDRYFRYNLGSIRSKINDSSYFSIGISEVYIYFTRTDYIVSAQSSSDSRGYFDTYYADMDMEYDEYIELLNEKGIGEFIYLPAKDGDKTKDEILYKYSVFNVDYNRPLATVVFRMPCSNFISMSGTDSDLWAFCVLDKDNRIFLSNITSEKNFDTIAQVVAELGGDTKNEYENYFILGDSSDENSWTYMFVINEEQYMSGLNSLRKKTTGFISIYSILGLLIAVIVTKRNYKPIRGLENRLRSISAKSTRGQDVDEMQYITEVVDRILKENETHSKRIEIQEAVIKDAVFTQLVNGESFLNESMENILYSLDIKFDHDYFTLVLFYIEDTYETVFENNQEEDLNDYTLAKIVVSNVLSDILKSGYDYIFCNLNSMLACIINSEKTDIKRSLVDSISVAQKIISENFNIRFSSGISGQHPYLEGIRLCYNEALECLEYKFVNQYGIIEYSNIIEQSKILYHFPIEREIRLSMALKRGDYANAHQILEEIFERNLKNFSASILMARCFMYEIMGMISRVIIEMNENGREFVFEYGDALKSLTDCTTLIDMKDKISEIFKEICDINSKVNDATGKVEEVVKKAKEYIDQHFADPNLNCNMVAAEFNIKNTYLSSMFKQQTSEGMLEYITKVRIEKSMELLKNTDMTIEKIAAAVGYTNSRTFSRAFVKMIGVSPGKVRG